MAIVIQTTSPQYDPAGGTMHRVDFIALCIGFACLLAYIPIGYLGATDLTSTLSDWRPSLIARMLCLAGTCITLLIWRVCKNHVDFLHKQLVYRISFFVAILSLVVIVPLSEFISLPVITCIANAVFGIALAAPLVGWFEALNAVYRSEGRLRCILVITLSYLLTTVLGFLVPIMEVGAFASKLTLAALVLLSWVCYEIVGHRNAFIRDDERSFNLHRENIQSDTPALRYHISRSSHAIVLCFGCSWSFCYTVAIGLGFGQGFLSGWGASLGVMLGGFLITGAIIGIFIRARLIRDAQFNQLLRFTAVIVGVGWALMPLCIMLSPEIGSAICAMTYVLIGIIMIEFGLEICREQGCSMFEVTFAHYCSFLLAAIAGGTLYLVVGLLADETVALYLGAAIAAITMFIAIPFLPDNTADTEDLVEEEGPREIDISLAEACDNLTKTYGLTAREGEILGLLIDGLSREDIAQTLSISTSTVKHHIANIYGKVGVHSHAALIHLLLSNQSEQ